MLASTTPGATLSMLATRRFMVTDRSCEYVIARHQEWCEDFVRSIDSDYTIVARLRNVASSSNDAEGCGAGSWPEIVSTVQYNRGFTKEESVAGGLRNRTLSGPAVSVSMVAADASGLEFVGPFGPILGELSWQPASTLTTQGNWVLYLPRRDVNTLGLAQHLPTVPRTGQRLPIRFSSCDLFQEWKKGDELTLIGLSQEYESAGVRNLPQARIWDAFRDAMPVDGHSIGAKLKVVVALDYDPPSADEMLNRKRQRNYGYTREQWTASLLNQVAQIG